MGWTAAAAIVSTAVSIGSSIRQEHQQKKAQKNAEAAAREAAKRNVTVKSQGAEPVRTSTENVEAGEVARQNARKRRQGYVSTLPGQALTSSLVGNKSKLGGV